MRRLSWFVAIVLFRTFPGFSQDLLNVDLDVDLIADSLLDGSSAVIRHYTTSYERESLEAYSMEVRYAVTVLNAHGKHAANLVIPYDRNSEVTEINGTIYNKQGVELGKLKKKDIQDYPSNASYTLFSDNRVKTTSPSYNNYPYTVEYSYRIAHDATVGFGNWMPLRWFEVATERAELLVKTPAYLGIRYKYLNYPFDFEADTTGDDHVYKWSAQQLKAMESESDLPLYLDYMPVVMLAPNDISYEGTEGSYQTWKDYGKWVFNLIKDRDALPEETVTRLIQLTDTIVVQQNKIKAVYQYMQNRTRYVNVALGIGGFQPLYAYEVDEKGYGDCKALSNYTLALLKSVGITSYYAEIGNGKSRELKYPDFASVNQTNHVILCVPLELDTIWLECTSQSIPFGYIGAGNSDRYALLVKESGGVLVRTPVYRASENRRLSKSSIRMDPGGNAKVRLETDFMNTEYEDIHGLLLLSRKEQREFLLRHLDLEGFILEDFTVSKSSSDYPEARISFNGNLEKYAAKSGKRLFLRPEYMFSKTSFKFIPENRKQDLYKPVGYHHIDSVSIVLPDNYQIESLPGGLVLDTEFGNYSLSISQSADSIQMIRNLEIYSGTVGKTQFEALNLFMKAISGSDQSRIILHQLE